MSINLNDLENITEPVLKLGDIQGLILRGYNFEYIRYAIFTIKDIAGAREFCKKILPGSNLPLTVTTATPWLQGAKPNYCFNVGFTSVGLAMLIGETNYGVVEKKSIGLLGPFAAGAVESAEYIGDTEDSDPKLWWKRSGGWQSPVDPAGDGSDLHVQVSIFTRDAESRESYYQTLLAMVPVNNDGPSLVPVFLKDSDPLPQGKNYIHFGYRDSLSQPRLTKVPWNTIQGRLLSGKSTIDDRPVVPPSNFAISLDKSTSGIKYNAHPLLENGSFAAFRLLYQDVKAFNKYINNPETGVSPDLLAAKMCGRWFDGTPLTVSPDKPDPSLKDFDYTNFNYMSRTQNQRGTVLSDDLGQVCPYAAHIRRTNPRDDTKVKGNDNPGGKAPDAQNRRIMRRASAYGPEYKEGEPDGIQRGLVGLFICAHLANQFQFIMNSWINQGGFRTGADSSPNDSGFDPLFGPPNDNMPKYNEFDFLPDRSATQEYKKVPGLERFVRTDGSMYLFLPGIKALEHLSNGTIPPPLS